MDKKDLPEKLVITEDGFISLEYASMYIGYGSDVPIIHLS